MLSRLFDDSINPLLGSPRQLICQCCGMPLEDANISREPDGTFNEEYCKWCYTDGKFVYTSLEELLNFPESHMSNEAWPDNTRKVPVCWYHHTKVLTTPLYGSKYIISLEYSHHNPTVHLWTNLPLCPI